MRLEGKIVDIVTRTIFEGSVQVEHGMISAITPHPTHSTRYILPGFVDAHLHIESSMLTPAAFGVEAVKHGTIAVVADPHEIANVCGVQGIDYMVEQASRSPLKSYFTAPSCVPSTPFERSGAVIGPEIIENLLQRDQFVALSEMMDYPGVITAQPDCMAKIALAKRYHKPVDGHAPALSGHDLQTYIDAGITTDHETLTYENALEKLKRGMYIIIRHGSSAKNLETLLPILAQYPEQVMFCSDDFKASDLKRGYINLMVKYALSNGYDLFDVLRAASLHPIRHYRLDVGLLQVGDPADFIVCDNLVDFEPIQVWIRGERVDKLSYVPDNHTINHFLASPLTAEMLSDPLEMGRTLDVIGVIGNQIVTDHDRITVSENNNFQKIIVLNRYLSDAKPAIGYIRGFNLHDGAIASTIAHDSHNIIATGSNDEMIIAAVNQVIAMKGGIAVCFRNDTAEIITQTISLPVAGLMTLEPIDTMIKAYHEIIESIKLMGCTLESPLMTLSFMALPVIPQLKMTDKGLFDVERFQHLTSISSE